MSAAISAHPLAWPPGWNRTSEGDRTFGRFNKKVSAKYFLSEQTYTYSKNLTVSDSVSRLLHALKKMGVDTYNDVVISTDLKLRLDGLPRSGQAQPEDPGACVYWVTSSGDRRCMAVDRYTKIADNLAAIAATLEAMRSIERHGGAEILDRAFTGFVALPSPSSNPWWSVLEYTSESDALANGFEERAKSLMQKLHPDKPDGDEWRFKQITKARDAGRGKQNV